MSTLEVKSLASWFGGNRMLAKHVGRELEGCSWVGIPFAGGLSEVPHITARTIQINDLHRSLVNMAMVAAHPTLGPKFYRRLRRLPFHPGVLKESQIDAGLNDMHRNDGVLIPDLDWAVDYFVCSWMGRSSESGKKREFETGLATRWEAGGGDSCVRFRSATKGLIAWRRILERANFTCMDAFEFLEKCKDRPGHGIYADPPWVDDGKHYMHTFAEGDHERLAHALSRNEQARVVIRYGDHPLIRQLYSGDRWRWIELDGRTQSNNKKNEVLIVNGPENAP